MNQIKVDRKLINVTNPNKILFPKDKITKLQIIEYYNNIGNIMLPKIKNHLLTMVRYPQGIHSEGFFHKNAPDFFPDWIKTLRVESRSQEDKITNYVVASNIATIVYLANYGSVTQHIWLSRIDKLNYPDRLIFDLDPANDKQFSILKRKAKDLKEILEQYGLEVFIMTTGSKGLHVVCPLKRKYNFDVIRDFAQNIAQQLIKDDPKNVTIEIRKDKRGNKIFIDTLRNSYTATAVAPYSIRAKDGAPIATPIFWQELSNSKLKSQSYNIFNIFKKLSNDGDPWSNFYKKAKNPILNNLK